MTYSARISILGLGYVGAVSAACFSKLGHDVIGVDIDHGKVNMLRQGRSPILEPGLEELTAQQHADGRLTATTDVGEAIANSDISLICVGTPSASNGSLDLTYVKRVCEQIGRALKDKLGEPDQYHVVVIRSTVLPGVVENELIPILEVVSGKQAGEHFGVVQNPEFLREGTAIDDFFGPPKTVIGAIDDRSGRAVAAIYEGVEAPMFLTSIGVASVVKYADNAFHATKITFGNEIGRFCKLYGVDSHEAMWIFTQDTKLNISPAYLRPGFAFGGSCLPKDLRAMLHAARMNDLDLPCLSSMLPSNKLQIEALTEKLLEHRRDGIGILGLSFKAGTDDLRESPMVTVVETLLGRGAEVRIYDPNLQLANLVGANLRYIMTEIPHIASLMKDSAEAVVNTSHAIVVGHNIPQFRQAVAKTREDQTVFDLVRLDNAQCIPAKYVGLCW